MKTELNSLEGPFRNAVEEACMLLTGPQALLGFQTVALFNQRCAELSVPQRDGHLVAPSLVVVSFASLMTPATYHRMVGFHQASEKTLFVSTLLIRAARFFLSLLSHAAEET